MSISWTLFVIAMAIGMCCGLYAVSLSKGNYIYAVKQYWEQLVRRGLLQENLVKPILLCDTCMASVWGTITYLFLFWLGPHSFKVAFILYVPSIFCVALGNYAVWTVLSTLRAIRDHHVHTLRATKQCSGSG